MTTTTLGPNGQRYLLGIWIALGVLTPMIGWGGARGFAPAIGVMGLLCVPLTRPTGKDWIGLALLAALALWAATSSLWSPADVLHPIHTLKELERFTGAHLALQVLCAGAFVTATGRMQARTAERSLDWLGYGLLVLAGILIVEGVTQAYFYRQIEIVIAKPVRPDIAVRNVAVAGYILSTLFWPAAATLWRRGKKPVVLGLAAAVIFSTAVLRGDSPSLALIISGVVFAIVYFAGRRAILALGVVAIIYFLTAPWLMLGLEKVGVFAAIRNHLPPSWGARLDIWAFTNARMIEDPIWGWGLDASRMFPGYIHLHPHDGAVQMWFELGVVGAVLAAAFWGFVFWRIWQNASERVFAATACATATVYLTIGAISFSLWQEWWVCLGAFAMAACVALRRFVDEPLRAPLKAP